MVITTEAQKKEIATDIQRNRIIGNEKVWTFLVANILANSHFQKGYLKHFCGEQIILKSKLDVWFEAEPIPPRIDEGNTKIDLCFGSIRKRENTELGIEFDPKDEESWVCFVEAKYFSDCSTAVSNDPLRNQIIRVLENLLCFQADGKYPKKLFFTLLTPRLFKENSKSRLYGYKMEEYKEINNILSDIALSNLKIREQMHWSYPCLKERVKLLRLYWVCYEDIIEREFGINKIDLTKKDLERDADVGYVIEELKKVTNGV